MKTSYSVITLAGATLLLASCAKQTLETPELGSITQNTQMRLSEAASSASHSLENLAMVEQAEHPTTKLNPPPTAESYGMGEIASIDWYGPVEPLVKRIATATQYTLRVVGVKPAIPVIVSITATDTPLGDILRDAGYQAHERATVVVFPSTRTIELRYAKS